MLKLLWLVPAIPFAGALVLAVLGARMPHKHVTVVGVGTVAASAFISILIATVFLSAPPASGMYTQTLWTWIDVGSFRPQIAFYPKPWSDRRSSFDSRWRFSSWKKLLPSVMRY
jgi:NADH-quinone oxidoreductase subunit L